MVQRRCADFFREILFLLPFLFLAACAIKQPASPNSPLLQKPSPASTEADQPNQTQKYAASRAKALSDISYSLKIDLDADHDIFVGTDQIKFTLSEVPSDLALDFRGGDVRELKIDGKLLDGAKQSGGLIALPQALLHKGENEVLIRYEQAYSRDGRGLYRFKDPEDGRVYLYTQFESFDANHLFPCFDQPDLKATYKVVATAPSDWTIVSTARESSIKKTDAGKRAQWDFPASPKVSPYVFSLHAGPYKIWTSKAGKIPLRLFARQSLAKYVDPKPWFDDAKAGLKFYGDYFGYPYPFKKYDQLIVPDFNAGAMENAAAITFSERLVHRGVETAEEKERLASILLHEMAHMWFGDLVTMRWWNGLWLNESFATYMSALAVQSATPYKQSWLSFYQSDKRNAYFADQLVTTHPIDGEIADTNSAFVNFDGITYGKGASVLKQLAFYIGEKNFRDGVRGYFKAHQYGNTELSDFIGSLEKASGKDLKRWSKLWLEDKGVDSVSANFACAAGKVSSFELAYLAPDGVSPSPRPRRVELGLYETKGGDERIYRTAAVSYPGVDPGVDPGKDALAAGQTSQSASSPRDGAPADKSKNAGKVAVPSLLGAKCPDFAYPNVGDQDYAKARLDAVSLKTAQTKLALFPDDLTRTMIWADLYEMVRDGDLPAQNYIELALQALPAETNIKNVESVVSSLQGRGALYYLPQSTPTEIGTRAKLVSRLEDMAWERLQAAKPGSDWQKKWFDSLVRFAETPKALRLVQSLLLDETQLKEFTLDQDRRWAAIARLNGFDFPGSAQLLATEKERDKSDAGVRAALAAEAIRPDAESKKRLMSQATDLSDDLSLARRRAILTSVYPSWQDRFRTEHSVDFFKDILRLSASADPEFLAVYVRAVPSTCVEESVERLDRFLTKNEAKLPPVVRKPLLVAREEDRRCVHARAVSAKK